MHHLHRDQMSSRPAQHPIAHFPRSRSHPRCTSHLRWTTGSSFPSSGTWQCPSYSNGQCHRQGPLICPYLRNIRAFFQPCSAKCFAVLADVRKVVFRCTTRSIDFHQESHNDDLFMLAWSIWLTGTGLSVRQCHHLQINTVSKSVIQGS